MYVARLVAGLMRQRGPPGRSQGPVNLEPEVVIDRIQYLPLLASMEDGDRWFGKARWVEAGASEFAHEILVGAAPCRSGRRVVEVQIAQPGRIPSQSGRADRRQALMVACAIHLCNSGGMPVIQWAFVGVGLALEAVIAWAWLVSPPHRGTRSPR